MAFDLKSIIIILLIIFLVVGVNLTLFGLLRGGSTARTEAAKWGQALSGGRETQRKNDADMAALHSAVTELKNHPPATDDTPPHD